MTVIDSCDLSGNSAIYLSRHEGYGLIIFVKSCTWFYRYMRVLVLSVSHAHIQHETFC